MNPGWGTARGRWMSRGASLALHLAVLAALWAALRASSTPPMMVFSVETVPGTVPKGEGSGARGSARTVTNQEAGANPLSGGLRLGPTDAPVAGGKEAADRRASPKRVQAPSLSQLDKLYAGMKIGVQPQQPGSSDEPSEGGMGDSHVSGTETGGLSPAGAIAGRGYRIGDYSYGKPLPEESEVVVLVTVDPKGEVLDASIRKTSGYPELDQHALSKARDIVFDPLPPGVQQVDETGTVTFRFEYSGAANP